MTVDPSYERNLDLIHDLVDYRMKLTRDASASVDTKATILAGFAITAAQFVLDKQVHGPLWVMSLLAYGAAVASAVVVLRLRANNEPPDPAALIERYGSRERGETLAAVIGTKLPAFRTLSDNHARKVRAWWGALAALVIALGLSVTNAGRSTVDERRAAIGAARAAAVEAGNAARAAERASSAAQAAAAGSAAAAAEAATAAARAADAASAAAAVAERLSQ